LRERASDIPQLVTFFLGQFSKKFGKRIDAICRPTMDRLLAYGWPGNIRELQNVIERAAVLCQGTVLELDEDLLPIASPSDTPMSWSTSGTCSPDDELRTLEDVERAHIVRVLERVGWLIEGPRGAARILAMHANTLRSRMEKLGIKRP